MPPQGPVIFFGDARYCRFLSHLGRLPRSSFDGAASHLGRLSGKGLGANVLGVMANVLWRCRWNISRAPFVKIPRAKPLDRSDAMPGGKGVLLKRARTQKVSLLARSAVQIVGCDTFVESTYPIAARSSINARPSWEDVCKGVGGDYIFPNECKRASFVDQALWKMEFLRRTEGNPTADSLRDPTYEAAMEKANADFEFNMDVLLPTQTANTSATAILDYEGDTPTYQPKYFHHLFSGGQEASGRGVQNWVDQRLWADLGGANLTCPMNFVLDHLPSFESAKGIMVKAASLGKPEVFKKLCNKIFDVLKKLTNWGCLVTPDSQFRLFKAPSWLRLYLPFKAWTQPAPTCDEGINSALDQFQMENGEVSRVVNVDTGELVPREECHPKVRQWPQFYERLRRVVKSGLP